VVKHYCLRSTNALIIFGIRKEGPGNQLGLKLNGTHQLLACADDVNLLGDDRYYKEKQRKFN
jgi:hypothetical protein